MINEVLDVMVSLAQEGMTMMVVTHEMGFARKVADRIVFMDGGEIVEIGEGDSFFTNPKTDRARSFLSKIWRIDATVTGAGWRNPASDRVP